MTETVSVKKLIRSKKGQSLIELTLLFPLMLLLVYGVVEVGQIISTYLTLTHTTREGANLTSRGTPPDTALDAVIAAAAPTIRDDNLGQWRIIYSEIVQKPESPCLTPPTGCTYEISDQKIRGNMPELSKLGAVGAKRSRSSKCFTITAPTSSLSSATISTRLSTTEPSSPK
ncbi:MAG: pilus assembly protein [Deltaproteobacteria bacterium]|nr:pilus assembly protein [Deltaproteobacteria bacterium]